MKTEFAPLRDALRLVPSRVLRRAHEHAIERADHGVSVKSDGGLGRRRQRVPPLWFNESGATRMILIQRRRQQKSLRVAEEKISHSHAHSKATQFRLFRNGKRHVGVFWRHQVVHGILLFVSSVSAAFAEPVLQMLPGSGR